MMEASMHGSGNGAAVYEPTLSVTLRLALPLAIEQHQCLACAVQMQNLEHARFWFLNETYREVPLVRQMVAAQGFCLNHTRWLLGSNATWQIGFIGEVLTAHNQQLAAKLQKQLTAWRWHRLLGRIIPAPDAGSAFLPTSDCLFCLRLREWERWALQDLIDYSGAADVLTVAANTCFAHVLMLAPRASSAFAAPMTTAVAARLETLLGRGIDNPETAAAFLVGRYPRTTRSPMLPTIAAELLGTGCGTASVEAPHATDSPAAGPFDGDGCALCEAITAVADPSCWPAAPPWEFCRPHLAALLAAGAPALLAQTLAEWARRTIAGHMAPARPGRDRRASGQPICRACGYVQQQVERALTVSVSADPAALRRSWFCLPHLPIVLQRVSPERALVVLTRAEELFGHLRYELREFFRKSAFVHRDEPKGREQTAWLRAADVLAGAYPADVGYDGDAVTAARQRAWAT
jgi:hypothetical protein